MSKKKNYKYGYKSRGNSIFIVVGVMFALLIIAGIASSVYEKDMDVHALEIQENMITLPLNGISEDISYYSYDHDGTYMELLAIEDSHGHIVLGMNTCYSCYASGQGYFEQTGDTLTCHNCGNVYSLDSHNTTVSTEVCAPLPITEAMYTSDGESITIDTSQLDVYVPVFEQWSR